MLVLFKNVPGLGCQQKYIIINKHALMWFRMLKMLFEIVPLLLFAKPLVLIILTPPPKKNTPCQCINHVLI